MKRIVTTILVVIGAALTVACPPCLSEGQNGVPDPEANEFQLVFNNIVSRDSDVHVNGEKVATICMETEFATIGNFPVGTDTTIMIHSKVTNSDCYNSPCCTPECSIQVCNGPPLVDTTPFAGQIYETGFIWQE